MAVGMQHGTVFVPNAVAVFSAGCVWVVPANSITLT